MGNGHAGVALPTSQILLFAQSWVHVVVPGISLVAIFLFFVFQVTGSRGPFVFLFYLHYPCLAAFFSVPYQCER